MHGAVFSTAVRRDLVISRQDRQVVIPLVIRVRRASTGLLVVGLVFVGLAQVLFDLVVKHPVFVELSD